VPAASWYAPVYVVVSLPLLLVCTAEAARKHFMEGFDLRRENLGSDTTEATATEVRSTILGRASVSLKDSVNRCMRHFTAVSGYKARFPNLPKRSMVRKHITSSPRSFEQSKPQVPLDLPVTACLPAPVLFSGRHSTRLHLSAQFGPLSGHSHHG
jgi:hypothetical protein